MSDNLSQEDIEKLLAGMPSDDGAFGGDFSAGLSNDQKETLNELSSISINAASTTLGEILSHRVEISSPSILEFTDISELLGAQDNSLIVESQYLGSIQSSVLLLFKDFDVAVIADIMMGGSGAIDSTELGEIQLSAVTEALNQMMISATSNLASIFNQMIEVSPPNVKQYISGQPLDFNNDIKNSSLVGIVYKISIGSVLDSEFIQILPIECAKNQVNMFMGSVDSLLQGVPGSNPQFNQGGNMDSPRMFGSSQDSQQDNSFSGSFGNSPVTVQPARFSSFDTAGSVFGAENQNLDLVLDVNLRLTVELGRSEMPIKRVLELTRGSVIELDKIAGEPVDLLANGKLIAKGEVVVIEDNFGLRITSIISPADRIKNL